MKKTIDSIMTSIREFFAKLERKQKIRLGLLALAIIVLAIVVATILGRTTYAVLYTGLEPAEAGNVTTELSSMGVSYKTEGTGTILVPEERVSELRMQLASLGYGSGGFAYDIFAQAEGFGSTDLEKQSYLLFQDEYNTRQLLLQLDIIKDCLVKVKLPEKSSFVLSSSNQQTASAAVTLELASSAALTSSQVDAIANLVSAGTTVPVENVYMVDTRGRPYTVGGEDFSTTGNLSYQLELQDQVRVSLETQVVNLLSAVFGDGNVKSNVAVELNFDDETIQSVVFEPPVEGKEEGMVLSMEEIYEYSTDGTAGGVVGTDPNGIGTVQYPYLDGEGYDYYYIARTFNYEMNETITNIEKAKATIKNLSIAVLINSESIAEDYTANVHNLVTNAIGVGANYVSVERLPFLDTSGLEGETSALEAAMAAMRRSEIIQLIIKALVVVALVVMVLLFLRTVVSTLGQQRLVLATAMAGPAGGESGIEYMAEGDIDLSASPYDDVDLSSKPEGIEQLEKFIDKDSTAIAQLLRNWLTDEE